MLVTITEWKILVLLRLLDPAERLVVGRHPWEGRADKESAWMLSAYPDGDVPRSVPAKLLAAGHIAESIAPSASNEYRRGDTVYTITEAGFEWLKQAPY
jgi:hypothetical protein